MLIFIYGPDDFQSREKLNQLKEKFVKKFGSSLSISLLNGQNLTSENFRNQAFSVGLFTKKRLIIIENIFENNGQAFLNDLIQFLEKKSYENIIIFYQSNQPILNSETKKKLFNLLKKQKYFYEFLPLDRSSLLKWLKGKLLKAGKEIDPQAANLLLNWTGNNLWLLSNEIEKLLAYAGLNKKITFDDVNLLAYPRLEKKIFSLIEAIAQKNKEIAISLLKDEFEARTSPSQLLALIIRQYQFFLQVKILKDLSLPNSEAKLYCPALPNFVAKKIISQAKLYTLKELKKIYNKLLTIDIKLKTTSIDPQTLFSLFILED